MTNDEIVRFLEARHPGSWLYGINVNAALDALLRLRNERDDLRSMLFEAAKTEVALTRHIAELRDAAPLDETIGIVRQLPAANSLGGKI